MSSWSCCLRRGGGAPPAAARTERLRSPPAANGFTPVLDVRLLGAARDPPAAGSPPAGRPRGRDVGAVDPVVGVEHHEEAAAAVPHEI